MWLFDMQVFRRLLILASLALLTACGFRLEGSEPLPEAFDNTYIATTDRYTYFYRSLTSDLRQRGVTLASGPASATAVIRINADSSGQSVTAVSARNTPLEYQAFYSIDFSVEVGGETVLENQSASLANRYEYDETKVLGKEEEFDMLSASQAKDLSRRVLIQLSKL